jgi:hypothetical protein
MSLYSYQDAADVMPEKIFMCLPSVYIIHDQWQTLVWLIFYFLRKTG